MYDFSFLKDCGLIYSASGYSTVRSVSTFYDISNESIKSIIKRNKMIFDHFGYVIKSGGDLKEIQEVKTKTRKIALLSELSVLKMAFFVISDMSLHIREILLADYPDLYKDLSTTCYTQDRFAKKIRD